MIGVREAKAALERAEEQARSIIAQARIDLGRAILQARAEGVPQKDIAAFLNLTREQVRRLQVAASKAEEASKQA